MESTLTVWYQNYNPLGFWPASTAVSALPVLTLFFVLIAMKKRVWLAALSGMIMAMLLAFLIFRMPSPMIGSACMLGFIFGFMRIGWIIIASIFLYNIAVVTGQFQVMKESIASLSSDRRLQLILIAFCFGAFLEGMGGGGAPVAVAGAFLIGLGFPPFQAATLCLLANTAPVAWGGVGNPIRALTTVTGLNESALNAMTGRILPPVSAILPLWLVRSMVSWKETREVWPAIAVSGLSFAGMQYYWANHQETGLVDIVASIFSLLVMVGFLKIWKPRVIRENAAAAGATSGAAAGVQELSGRSHSMAAVLKAWLPFMLASVFIFVSGMPSVTSTLSFSSWQQPVPLLHNLVFRVPPVVPKAAAESAIADLNIIALPGTAIFVGAALSAILLGMSAGRIYRLFIRTFVEMVPAILAICFMVGLAFVTRYSGMDTVLGLSLTRTGTAYPFFGTLLGWLGVALTGTDVGSNALFGNLQKVTAEQLNLDPVLMSAANSSGGVMGKMIAPQSIVVSSASTLQVGNEAAIFKAVFKHSIVLASLIGLIVTFYAFVIPWIIPR